LGFLKTYSAFRNPHSAIGMRLIIDGYNLLHVNRFLTPLNVIQFQWERDRLIDQLSTYQKLKSCEITVVFDGWQGGWSTEKRERKNGIDLIFSKLGEKADEVIKRLVKEKGSGAIVITSDRDVSKFAERMDVAVIPSERFIEKIDQSEVHVDNIFEDQEEEGRNFKRKGPSRKLSKKEKRARDALKKL
jgi:predicted RNA-binding protein with PIN domain